MKKKSLKLLVMITVLLLNVKVVNAATNPYKPKSSFGVNCTWYAWDQVYKRLGIALPGWGNANTWYDYAKKAGFEVGSTPRANSIVVWQWDKYGHVAFVEKVKGDKIYIWDSGGPCIDYDNPELKECIANGVSEETDRECVRKYGKETGCEYPATYWKSPGDLIGYIYLDKIPAKPVNATTTPQKTTSVKKSNNAYLKTLTIPEIAFDFKKETENYEFVIENEVEKINIKGEAEHSKAKIEGLGEQTLKVGTNVFNIVVTAEDGSKKTYTLNIKRKDNNAFLRTLTIENIDFTFDKNTLEYELNVENEMENIKIEGLAESELASIEGLNEYELQEGKNTIIIKVTAEDETEKIYTLNINREKKPEEKEEQKERNFIIYIILGSTLLLAIMGGVIAIILKKCKKKNKK